MKKIIQGKKYDTETATLVAACQNLSDETNIDYQHKALYKKRTGEYFVAVTGCERYRDRLSEVIPVSYDEARSFAERWMDADEWEREFGEVSEDDGDVAVTVRVPASAKTALDRECSKTGESRSAIVARLLGAL